MVDCIKNYETHLHVFFEKSSPYGLGDLFVVLHLEESLLNFVRGESVQNGSNDI